MNVIDKAIWFFALSLQLFNKYLNFATVVTLQAHTAYMWDVESRRSQVKKKIYSNKPTYYVRDINFLAALKTINGLTQ